MISRVFHDRVLGALVLCTIGAAIMAIVVLS